MYEHITSGTHDWQGNIKKKLFSCWCQLGNTLQAAQSNFNIEGKMRMFNKVDLINILLSFLIAEFSDQSIYVSLRINRSPDWHSTVLRQ